LRLAAQVGARLRGGEVIELVSDLGGGKTTFVKGLARGMGSDELVSSPSFTLRNEYQGNDLKLYHFDFHRLHEPGILREELSEVLDDPKAVTVIEWADIVADLLPAGRMTIGIRPIGTESREFTFQAPKPQTYLFPNNT
jgi:tRNA threonylcarbamoyladenosine biosynthesis protein TsaE